MSKNKVFQLRMTEKELVEAKELANREFEGNLSLLIRKLLNDYKEGVKK